MPEYTVTSQFIPAHTDLSWNTVNLEKSADLWKPISGQGLHLRVGQRKRGPAHWQLQLRRIHQQHLHTFHLIGDTGRQLYTTLEHFRKACLHAFQGSDILADSPSLIGLSHVKARVVQIDRKKLCRTSTQCRHNFFDLKLSRVQHNLI